MTTAVDLFAGAGGLSVGLARAGFSVRAAVEIDKTSAASYARNHPNAKVIVGDICRITGPELLRAASVGPGELDLLSGCPPCQGFSSLRTRRQASCAPDRRNDLVFEVLRLVRSVRPRAVLIENVPGLMDDGRFVIFRDGLRRAGYSMDAAILDAQYFGVPQRRRRLVVVAIRGRTVPRTLWEKPRTKTPTVRDAIGRLPAAGASGDPLHDLPEQRSEAIVRRIAATPTDGGSRSDVAAELRCACHTRSSGYSDVYGRMAWDKVSPTITGGCHNPSRGRFIHPVENRAITLREAALLQSFPPAYEFDLSRGKEHVARQIGNAFPPLLIEPIARRLLRELS